MTAREAEALRWLEEGPGMEAGPPRPFLLVTPLGLVDDTVARTFAEGGVMPRQVLALPDYPRASLALYARRPSLARVAQGLAYEAAWRALCPRTDGVIWVLDDRAFAVAWQLKAGLRARWLPVVQGALLFRTFHLPDPDDLARQWAWLKRLARPERS